MMVSLQQTYDSLRNMIEAVSLVCHDPANIHLFEFVDWSHCEQTEITSVLALDIMKILTSGGSKV